MSVYRHDERNLGDLWSVPARYFDFLPYVASDVLDIADIQHEDAVDEVCADAKAVIVGGGGMFGYCDFQLRILVERLGIAAGRRRPRIVFWGAGNGRSQSLPLYLSGFDLYSVRDWPLRHAAPWVPCASCLHPLFDTFAAKGPIHDTVIYDALLDRIEGFPDHPRLVNDGANIDLEAALSFISDGRTVITRSYHGAYWSSLLGRRAIVPDPVPQKMLGLKHVRRLSDRVEVVGEPQALTEARTLNRAFGQKVSDMLAA